MVVRADRFREAHPRANLGARKVIERKRNEDDSIPLFLVTVLSAVSQRVNVLFLILWTAAMMTAGLNSTRTIAKT